MDIQTHTDKIKYYQNSFKQEFEKLKSTVDSNHDELQELNTTNSKRLISYCQLGIDYFNKQLTIHQWDKSTEIFEIVIDLYIKLSKVYLKIGKINECLITVEKGLLLDQDNYEFYFILSNCYKCKCNFKESLKYIKLSINKNNNNNNNNKKVELIKEMNEIEKCINDEIEINNNLNKRNNNGELSFKNVLIKWNSNGSGRTVYSKSNLKSGDKLFRIAPFAAVVESRLILKVCGHCFQKVPKNQRPNQICNKCNFHITCSKCKLNSYHQSTHFEECKFYKFLNRKFKKSDTRDTRFMFRIFINIINGKKGKIDSRRINSNNGGNNEKEEEFGLVVDGYNDFLNLTFSRKEMNNKDYLDAIKLMYYIVDGISNDDSGKQLKNDFIKYLTLEEMLKCYSIVKSNSHTIPKVLSEGIDGFDLIGNGIYTTGCYINHSCTPNAIWDIDEYGNLVFYTLSNIKKGDELFISYCNVTSNVYSRRIALLEDYSFFCSCNQCEFQSSVSDELCNINTCNQPLFTNTCYYTDPTLNSNESGFNYICSNGHCNKELIKSPEYSNLSSFRKFCKYRQMIESYDDVGDDGSVLPIPELSKLDNIYNLISIFNQSLNGNPNKDQFSNSLKFISIQIHYQLFKLLKSTNINNCNNGELIKIKKTIISLINPIIYEINKNKIELKLITN